MRWLVLVFAVLSPVRATAQSILQNAAADLKHAAGDVLWVWTSPARLETRDLAGLGVVLAGTGAALLVDEPVQRWVGDHPRSAAVQAFGWFREEQPGEELGNIWLLIRASSVGWVAGLLSGSETLREASLGCATAGIAQTFPRRLIVYRAVARTRPGYTDDALDFSVPGSSDWERRSFFGGHAANAMTCMAFFAGRYRLGYAEPVLYAAAIGTGVARVLDRAHWTSDTFLGLAFGYAIGRAVALRSRSRAAAAHQAQPGEVPAEPARRQPSLSLQPAGDGGIAFAVRW